MDVTVMDPVFGEMTYRHRWFKNENITFWGKEFPVVIAAKAFSGKPITDEQRESYTWFKQNLNQVDETMTELASNYINENCQELVTYWRGARMIQSADDLKTILTPKTILFTKNRAVLVLLDCPWDEHGIAIQLRPSVEIGSQDMFL